MTPMGLMAREASMAAARAGARRPVAPDPMIFAPSGETWASVRTLYEAGSLAKVSVARLAGISGTTLKRRAQKDGWGGAPGGAPASQSVVGVAPPNIKAAAVSRSRAGQAPPRGTGGRFVKAAGVVPPPAAPAAALPGSLRDPTLPQGEGGCTHPGVESVAVSAIPQTSPAPSAPDLRTQPGRAALVDQLYGLFAAQLSAAGADGLGGALEQRMRSLATFAKTLDALVDLDQRLGAGAATGEADFDAYRAELARCLAGLVGEGG